MVHAHALAHQVTNNLKKRRQVSAISANSSQYPRNTNTKVLSNKNRARILRIAFKPNQANVKNLENHAYASHPIAFFDNIRPTPLKQVESVTRLFTKLEPQSV